jgi:hypothetical protein
MADMTPINKHDIVCEFAGICSTTADLQASNYHCIIEVIRDALYLTCVDNKADPFYKAQYINHSCEPNCNIEVWNDHQGWPRILVIARQDLSSGTEVTVNYNTSICQSSTPIECKCGMSRCKGFIAAPLPSTISQVTAESPALLE